MEVTLIDCEQCGKTVLTHHLVKGGFKLCDSCNIQQNELNNGSSDDATHACWFEDNNTHVRSDLFMGSEDMVFEQFFSDYHQLSTADDIDQDEVEEAFFLGQQRFDTHTLHVETLDL